MSTEDTRRRRRTREKTRDLQLEAAVRLVMGRTAGNGAGAVDPPADVLISDVLAGADRAIESAGAGARAVTTGAAYNIWPALADFRADPPSRVLYEAATPGMDRVRAATLNGPAALAAPRDVAAGEQRANQRYVADAGELLEAMVRYAGRRLRAGRTIEDLVWAIEALGVGYLLRMRVDAGIPLRQDAEGTSALASAVAGVMEAFTAPDEAASRSTRRRAAPAAAPRPSRRPGPTGRRSERGPAPPARRDCDGRTRRGRRRPPAAGRQSRRPAPVSPGATDPATTAPWACSGSGSGAASARPRRA